MAGTDEEDLEIGALKQAHRERDAKLLESGQIKPGDLDRKNGFFASIDFSKVKILAIGGRKIEDID